MVRLIFFIFLLSFFNSVNAAYKPPLSVEKYIETLKVNRDAKVEQTIESIVQIETQKGVEEEGQQSIIFNSKLENVQLVDAYTLQPDGKKIKVAPSGIKIKDDDSSEGAPMFTETKRFIVIYPEVKVGSKLYYKFKSLQHTPDFKGHFYRAHYFSPHYQYQNVVIDLKVHESLPLKIDTKNMGGGLIDEDKGYKHYSYHFVQTDTHNSEASEAAVEDFASYFTASTFADWFHFGKAYQEGLRGKTVVTSPIQQLANQLTVGLKDDASKVRSIHNWVSKNIRYVAVYLGNGGVVPHDADTILKNQYGDCKDHAVLLETLLKAVKIDSSSALINLGDSYRLPKLAVMTPLNHVINYVPSLNLYLDSTAQYSPYGALPSEDMDKPVILTRLGKLGHTPKFDSKRDAVSNHIELKINKDGSIVGKGYSSATGYLDVDYRDIRANHLDEDDEGLVRRRLSQYGESGTGGISATDPLDLNTPFAEKTAFFLDPISNFPGPGAMRVPYGLSFNMLAQLAKHKPINKLDFPSQCYSFTLENTYSLSFPDNVRITRLPEKIEYQSRNIKYQATYQKRGSKVFVHRLYEEMHPQAICGNDENEQEKAFYSVLQRDLRSQIFYE